MTGPSVSDMILKVASASNASRGISLDALKKGLSARSYDVVKNSFRVSLAVKRLVANGELIQTKGTGASGSFKISKVQNKKTVKKAKKPRAKKVKKTTPNKSATPNKSPKKTKRKLRSTRPSAEWQKRKSPGQKTVK